MPPSSLDTYLSASDRKSIARLLKATFGLGCRFLSGPQARRLEAGGTIRCEKPGTESGRLRGEIVKVGEVPDQGQQFRTSDGSTRFLIPLLDSGRRAGYAVIGPFLTPEDTSLRDNGSQPEAAAGKPPPVLMAPHQGALALIRDWMRSRVQVSALRAELNKKENLLISLVDSTRIIHTTQDVGDLLEYLTDISIFLTQGIAGFILMLDESGDDLEVAVARGLDMDLRESYRVPVATGVSGWVVRHGETLNIPDTSKDDRYIDVGTGALSEVAVPILRNDRVVGVLIVDSDKPDAFSSFDEHVLASLAFQVSTVHEAMKLEAERGRKLSELQAVQDISRKSGTTLEVEELIPRVLEVASSAFEASGAALLLVDSPEDTLFVWVAESSTVRKVENYHAEEGLFSEVLSTHASLLVHPDATETSRRFERFLPSGSTSGMCVPLTAQGEFLGALLVTGGKPGERPFGPADLELLNTLTAPVSQAVRNAELFARSRRQVAELSLINEIAKTLSSSLDLEEVLHYIIEVASELVGAERSSLMMWDPKTERLAVSVCKGLDPSVAHHLSFKPGEGIAGISAQTQTPLRIDNTREDPRYLERASGEAPATLMTAPIVNKGRVLGVLNLERPLSQHPPFNEEDLHFLTTLATHAGIAIENARLYQNLIGSYFETIRSLASALEAKDAYTHGHSRRVARDSVRIGQKMGLARKDLETIRHGALLHDIGKIGIPDKILLKPGALTSEELATIRKHPLLGANMIQSIEFLEEVREIIRHHHERWDGKGFPYGLSGEDIPLNARIACVADAFDAMVTTRPYRRGMSYQDAIVELERNRGSQFDPAIVDVFVELLHSMHPEMATADGPFNPRIELQADSSCDWIEESRLGQESLAARPAFG